MIIETKENFIKKLKLNSNVNKLVFAKTLFAMTQNPSNEFLELVANTMINRFVMEAEITDEIPNFVMMLSTYKCWKDLKFMESIDFKSDLFQKCLKIASRVLMGNLNNEFSFILSFHKKLESHLLTNNIKPKFEVDGFSFFDVYI